MAASSPTSVSPGASCHDRMSVPSCGSAAVLLAPISLTHDAPQATRVWRVCAIVACWMFLALPQRTPAKNSSERHNPVFQSAAKQVATMRVRRLDHVLLAMPAGRELDARNFYSGILGIPETKKPAELVGRGG